MTSANPETERELPAVPPQRFVGAFVFSVALHGVILVLLTRTVLSLAPEDSPAAERPSIRVSLAPRQPRPQPEPPAPQPEQTVPELPADLPPARVEEPPAPPVIAETVPVLSSTEAPLEVVEEPATPSSAVDPPWSPARIRIAIETSRSDLRSNATATWMEDCIVERKERGTRDCEQQLEAPDFDSADMAAARAAGAGSFAGVRRANEKWLVEEQYRKKNDAIRGLIDAEGILGEVAAARYYINRDNISYLSGYFGDYVMGAMGNFSADVLGGPRLTIGGAGGNTAFSCAKYVTTKGGRKVKVPAACVYEYTGFEIVRPEVEPDPNEFRVVPLVIGGAR